MENASKALIIAGGILISIIVISIFYFSFGRLGTLVGESESDNLQKEIMMFNKGFEAYNKKLMYGADIISVLNKAIDNNKSYGVEFYNEPENSAMLDYYVDVIFSYNRKSIEGYGNDEIVTYSLKQNYTKGENTIKTQFLLPMLKGENSVHSFKVAGFKCSGVSYVGKKDTNNISAIGRLNRIEFVEIKN